MPLPGLGPRRRDAVRAGAGRAVAVVLRWALRLGLPLAGAAAMLHSFPYRTTVDGVPFRVEGTLIAHPGISADTTFGSWQFPHVSALPVGVHLTPVDVDVLAVAREAYPDTASWVERLRSDLGDQVPRILLWLAAEALVGVLLGLAAAASINLSVRYLRGLPRRAGELRHRVRQLAAALLVVAAVAGAGVGTLDRQWYRQSELTGTLAAAQLFPSELQQYYGQQSKLYDVLGSVLSIQSELSDRIDRDTAPPAAFRIMFVSDVHLAAVYPLVAQYAAAYRVSLLINTGDETEFGTAAELTPSYLQALAALTAKVPMLWLAGNHDSPAVEAVMRSVTGVTVLGSKASRPDGSMVVSAGEVSAFGLTVAGVPDPRVYGAVGPYGADVDEVTDPLERSAVDAAVAGIRGPHPPTIDVFATHEPVAADRLRADLPGAIRQTNSGHTHRQNPLDQVQDGSAIDLVEGSTGAGGLDNLGKPGDRPPIEFSIESVGADCQFTRIQRFQVAQAATATPGSPEPDRDSVTVSTLYPSPQEVAADRRCGTAQGISAERPLGTDRVP